jgi:integrase
MPTVALTDISIRNLKPVAGKRITYLDKSLKGFGVRVTETGKASYVLTYGPNRQRVKLGDVGIVKLADARQQAKNILAERQLGIRQPSGSITYQTAVAAFLEAKGKHCKPRTLYDYKRLLTRHGFGAERLADIAPRDIHRTLDRLKESERAHAQAALQIFFRFAVRRHYLDRNPLERLDPPAKRPTRARILTDHELKTVWQACTGMFGDIVRLCILTGQRRSEIGRLTWEMIDRKQQIVTLPPELTKNRREHVFPYGERTAELLTLVGDRASAGYLFPARKTWRGKATVYHAWNKDKAKLDQASAITGWILHDLRRTFVSNWAALGIRQEVTEKYINHVSGTHGGLRAIYDRHSYADEMRAAVERWEKRLISVVAQDSPGLPGA